MSFKEQVLQVGFPAALAFLGGSRYSKTAGFYSAAAAGGAAYVRYKLANRGDSRDEQRDRKDDRRDNREQNDGLTVDTRHMDAGAVYDYGDVDPLVEQPSAQFPMGVRDGPIKKSQLALTLLKDKNGQPYLKEGDFVLGFAGDDDSPYRKALKRFEEDHKKEMEKLGKPKVDGKLDNISYMAIAQEYHKLSAQTKQQYPIEFYEQRGSEPPPQKTGGPRAGNGPVTDSRLAASRPGSGPQVGLSAEEMDRRRRMMMEALSSFDNFKGAMGLTNLSAEQEQTAKKIFDLLSQFAGAFAVLNPQAQRSELRTGVGNEGDAVGRVEASVARVTELRAQRARIDEEIKAEEARAAALRAEAAALDKTESARPRNDFVALFDKNDPAKVTELQETLASVMKRGKNGTDVKTDGKWESASASLKEFQRQNGLEQTGELNINTLARIAAEKRTDIGLAYKFDENGDNKLSSAERDKFAAALASSGMNVADLLKLSGVNVGEDRTLSINLLPRNNPAPDSPAVG